MFHRLISRLTFANVIAMISLFVGLSGGVAYAAALAENSVTRRTIQNSAVNGPKVANKSLSEVDITGAAIDKLTYVTAAFTTAPQLGVPVRATASCPDGKNVVGGGGSVGADNNSFGYINTTYPSSRTSWTVEAQGFNENDRSRGAPGTVYAICAPARTTAP